jgi:hypothetical protein
MAGFLKRSHTGLHKLSTGKALQGTTPLSMFMSPSGFLKKSKNLRGKGAAELDMDA